MSRPPSHSPGPVPGWLRLALSVAIVFHLGAVLAGALAAPSGPWPGPDGAGPAPPPRFALLAHSVTGPRYLGPLKMTHNYHFATNRPGGPEAEVEFRLTDSEGRPLTLTLPDPSANPWVRHRQALLARALAEDLPVPTPQGEAVAPAGQLPPPVHFWEIEGARVLKLASRPEHLLPRDRPVFRPSEWSLLLAHSYARHLCRRHGASSVEVVRHTRDAVPPAVLFQTREPPASAFGKLTAHFGELPR